MLRTAIIVSAAVALAGCETGELSDAAETAGEAVADGAQAVAGTTTSLVNVDLSNVLNDLALDLNIERANIPVNAQVPITIAANVCGVSINILSASTGGQATCTATATSPELTQVVQQQISAGGNVGGGSQTSGEATGETTSGSTDSQTEPPDQDPPQ